MTAILILKLISCAIAIVFYTQTRTTVKVTFYSTVVYSMTHSV